jgi:outer membrane biosynthesis protein TonB
MQPRQLLIVAIVAIVAFGGALAIAGAGGGDDPKAAAPAAQPAKVIEVEPVTISAAVAANAKLPALKVPRKKPATPDATTPPVTSDEDQGQATPIPTPAPNNPTQPDPLPTAQPTPAPTEDPIIIGGGND